MLIPTKAKCPECLRVFDLMDEDEAGEWYYGHDCDESLVDEAGNLIEIPSKTGVDIRGAIPDNQAVQGRSDPTFE